MKAYKGFNKDMTCRGFQFKEGETYVEESAELCRSGFHACENPLDVFAYYPPADSVYHEVELDEVSEERGDDSKVTGKKIKIGAALSIKNLVDAHVEYVKEHIAEQGGAYETGCYSAATNTGNCSVATNTGDCSVATSTGYRSVATGTGYYSAATNTGNCSVATSTGYRSVATSTGYRSVATGTGYCSAATNTGNCSVAEVSGKQSVAMAIGPSSKARGALGCWVVLAEWGDNGIADVKCAKVDGVTIKPDVWYKLKIGEFVEVQEDDD